MSDFHCAPTPSHNLLGARLGGELSCAPGCARRGCQRGKARGGEAAGGCDVSSGDGGWGRGGSWTASMTCEREAWPARGKCDGGADRQFDYPIDRRLNNVGSEGVVSQFCGPVTP